MNQPWELQEPVPENQYDQNRRRRRQLGTALIALLVVAGLVVPSLLSIL